MDNYYYRPPGVDVNADGGENRKIDYAALNALNYMEKAKHERREIRRLGNIIGLAGTAYVIVQIISVLLIRSSSVLYDKFMNSVIFQDAFAAIAVEVFALLVPFSIVALVCKKNYETSIIPSKPLPFSKIILWVFFGVFCCLCGDYLITILTSLFDSIGHSLEVPDYPKPDSALAVLIVVVCNSVIPAICEEFSLRCCTLGLLKKYGKAFGVVAVSILFGLLHGNMVQFVFATVIGLILGYITVKTDSIVPAVLIHGLNNGISVISDASAYFFGEETQDYISYYMMMFLLAAGVISLAILALKGQFKREKTETEFVPYKNSFGKKLASFFFVPGMIFPFLYLGFSIVSSIG